MKLNKRLWSLLWLMALILASSGCGARPVTAPAARSLSVKILYPGSTDTRLMGQSLKSIVQVLDEQGASVADAQVTLSIMDATGKVIDRLPATAGSGDVYRTAAWNIPHKEHAGEWTVQAEAQTEDARGAASTAFRVKNSVSEDLLEKYGFWVDSPSLRGIIPDLYRQQGDARNGAIIWGGVLPAQHIFPESWLEVQWREGDFHLSTPDQVRTFLLDELGDIGIAPVRAVGPYEQVKFKGWDAWLVKARGQYLRYDEQWMIFYAPEAGKTYALGTTVVQAPGGMDPHATLRDGFALPPGVQANGTAPVPLLRLLPRPELLSPELGTRFMGLQSPIVLSWKPLKALAPDEYYEVKVDYNYSETNTTVPYTTRATTLLLPESLYEVPNCGVFNWQVTLMKQTGVDADGQPEGSALSYSSLYWYVEWLYPAGSPMPFSPRCPNPQI